MSLITCPSCKADIHDRFKTCPLCDADISQPIRYTQQPEKKATDTEFLGRPKIEWYISGGIFMIAMIFLTVYISSREPVPELTRQELRTLQIEEAFFPGSGAHIRLERTIKESMGDPDSYDHVKTIYIDHGDYLTVTTKYRGANKFGGKVFGTTVAKVSIGGKVLEILLDQ